MKLPPSLAPAPVLLLADDNEANIATLTSYLQSKGYQIVAARSGAEALERAREMRPALILMDIQMPGMDGLEATRRLRADTDLVAIPIIALTALAMPGDRERCLEAGANEYLSKPVSLKRLIEVIELKLGDKRGKI
jgi:CheY-like chemotaxis protein